MGQIKAQTSSNEVRQRLSRDGNTDEPLPMLPKWWHGVAEVRFDGKIVLVDSMVRVPRKGSQVIEPILRWGLKSMWKSSWRFCGCKGLLHYSDEPGLWARISCPRPNCGLLLDFYLRTSKTKPDIVVVLND